MEERDIEGRGDIVGSGLNCWLEWRLSACRPMKLVAGEPRAEDARRDFSSSVRVSWRCAAGTNQITVLEWAVGRFLSRGS